MLSELAVSCVISIHANKNIVTLINKVSDKYHVSRELVHALIKQESNYYHSAVNKVAPIHSYGLGQLTRATAKSFCGIVGDEIMDLKQNLECSVKYLAWQIDRYKGDEFKAISAYNNGTYTKKNYVYTMQVFRNMLFCYSFAETW